MQSPQSQSSLKLSFIIFASTNLLYALWQKLFLWVLFRHKFLRYIPLLDKNRNLYTVQESLDM